MTTTTPTNGAADLPEALRKAAESLPMLRTATTVHEDGRTWIHHSHITILLDAVEVAAAALAAGQATAAKQAPECPSMPETWHVVAHVLGEPILSIGYDWLSGKGELTEAETQAVIGMAQHMLAFVGYGLPPSSFDPDADEATAAQAAPAAVAGPSGYGPKATVKRSCSDCKACNSESYAVQGDSGHYVYCEHPSLPESKYIGDTNWNTPHWCPVAAPTTQPAPRQGPTLHDLKAALAVFNTARAGSDKPSGYLRGIRAVLAHWESRPPATSVQEDAARWHWLAEYLVGPRTDLDDEIVASETVNDLRKLVDAARAAQEGK